MADTVTVVSSGGVTKEVAVAALAEGGAPEEVLARLESLGIESHVTVGGALLVRVWHVANPEFVSPEVAAALRDTRPAPTRDAGALEWFGRNLSTLQAEFPGRWVAIHDDRVVADAESLTVLMASLREQGIEKPFVTQVPPQPSTRVRRRIYAG